MDTVVKKVRKTAKERPFLPDEIIINILIRLPVKSVVRCGIVCKKWRDITLARDFVDLHLKSSNPVILVSNYEVYSRLDLFALDKWWEFARNRLMSNRFPFYSQDFPFGSFVVFSHAGLIVLRGFSSPKYFILNPARPSNECVKITLSEEIRRINICAVYYHPSLKEYVSLWKIDTSVCKSGPLCGQPELVQYKLLNFGSYPSLKTISISFNYTMKDNHEPVFINNYLYWMIKSEQEYKYWGRNDILEFDIISEEFMVIPCPVPLNTECMSQQTHLLNSDGILLFLLILPSTITIWKLEDRVQQLWTTTEYTLSQEVCQSNEAVGIIALVDGMLAFEYERRLFICNLKEGTVKNNPKRKYSYGASFFSHQPSLASLKSCKSEIYIDKDSEVVA